MNSKSGKHKLSDSLFAISCAVVEPGHSKALVNSLLQLIESLIVGYYLLLTVKDIVRMPEDFDVFKFFQKHRKVL
jgi:hypothetical protein